MAEEEGPEIKKKRIKVNNLFDILSVDEDLSSREIEISDEAFPIVVPLVVIELDSREERRCELIIDRSKGEGGNVPEGSILVTLMDRADPGSHTSIAITPEGEVINEDTGEALTAGELQEGFALEVLDPEKCSTTGVQPSTVSALYKWFIDLPLTEEAVVAEQTEVRKLPDAVVNLLRIFAEDSVFAEKNPDLVDIGKVQERLRAGESLEFDLGKFNTLFGYEGHWVQTHVFISPG